MARQNINTGTAANDGSGDTLRAGAQKINDNFVELYLLLGADSDNVTTKVSLSDSGVVFEAATYKTTLGWTEGSSDFTIKLPSSGSNLVGDTSTQTLTNKSLDSAQLKFPEIKDADSSHSYKIISANLAADRNINLPLLTDSDTLVFEMHTQTLTNKTLNSPTVNTPIIGGGIVDSNGAEFLHFTTTASAVNDINITNAATSNNPQISSYSTVDTNVNLALGAQGNAYISMESSLRFRSETIVSDAQAISLDRPLTRFNATTDIDATLADGRTVGETKHLLNDATSSTVTVTPTNFAQGTSFTMRANAYDHLIWSGSAWHLRIDQAYPSSNSNVFTFVTA